MRITQAHISTSLYRFKDDFFKRWQLHDYADPNAPALFIGFYSPADIIPCKNHKGFKVVLYGGADIVNAHHNVGLPVAVSKYTYENTRLHKFHKVNRFVCPPWKDYSNFKPVKLGTSVYCYINNTSDGAKRKYHFDIAEQISKYWPVRYGVHGHSIDEMIEHFYTPSFVNLQLNHQAGFTSAVEMAHMGRKSISNHDAPFCIPFANHVSNILHLIDRESLKIGTIQDNAGARKFVSVSDEWLTTDFYAH